MSPTTSICQTTSARHQRGFGDAQLLGYGLLLPAAGVLVACLLGGAGLWKASAEPEQKPSLSEQLAKESAEKARIAALDAERRTLLSSATVEIAELDCGIRPAKHELICISVERGFANRTRTFKVHVAEKLPLLGLSYRAGFAGKYTLTYSAAIPQDQRVQILHAISQGLANPPKREPGGAMVIYG